MTTASKGKSLLFTILKWVFLLLIFLFLYHLTSGNRTSNADFTTVSDAVLGSTDLSQMLEGDSQMVRRIYGLNPDDYDGVVYYYPSTNMGAEELLLVKLKDLSQQSAVQEAMEARVSSQMSAFEGYAPEQYSMLEQGIIEVQGNYLLLIVAEDPDAVRTAFLNSL